MKTQMTSDISVTAFYNDDCHAVFVNEKTRVALLQTATWCNQSVGQFIETAIKDRLNEVQAAMGEEELFALLNDRSVMQSMVNEIYALRRAVKGNESCGNTGS